MTTVVEEDVARACAQLLQFITAVVMTTAQCTVYTEFGNSNCFMEDASLYQLY